MASNGQTILVIGLGRFGYALAKELRDTGRDIMVVDSNPAIVAKHSNEFERIAEADCTNHEALAQLGIEDFHSVVIAIGGDQESSILTTALVADFGIENIWAKAMTPQHAKILKRIGAHNVVQPEFEMGVRVAHLVSQKTREYLEIGDDWVLVKTSPIADITGKPLSDTQLRRKLKVTIVSYRPQHSNDYRPADGATVLTYGDEIVVVGAKSDVDDYLSALARG